MTNNGDVSLQIANHSREHSIKVNYGTKLTTIRDWCMCICDKTTEDAFVSLQWGDKITNITGDSNDAIGSAFDRCSPKGRACLYVESDTVQLHFLELRVAWDIPNSVTMVQLTEMIHRYHAWTAGSYTITDIASGTLIDVNADESFRNQGIYRGRLNVHRRTPAHME